MSVTPDKPKREHRGRPGKYPGSPKTVRMRVPEGTEAYVQWCLTELPRLHSTYMGVRKETRNWNSFNSFVSSLRESQWEFIKGLEDSGEIEGIFAPGPDGGEIIFHAQRPEHSDGIPF